MKKKWDLYKKKYWTNNFVNYLIFFSLFLLLIICFEKIFNPSYQRCLYELNYAQKCFEKGYFYQSLHTDSKHLGFLGIISTYPFTQEENISKFYASICYYKLGDYKKSIKMMKKFQTKEKFSIAMKYGIIGDSYIQMNQRNHAIHNYIKAANVEDNDMLTPIYYYKISLLYLNIKKYENASYFLNKIKNKYPNFLYIDNVDKYLSYSKNQQYIHN
ncbi:tetratricopeptide repeat protein [Blattabacterium cuenoti]|uniref:tetratricopeptide repeat protein n=1 Tax=Blattabacterium cuenoti TaxID=1653831 RepID=UPI00163C903A|nr:tetratricopeptide repeat protein [Blattabacterium cuenoti]